jgi:hypothetical protein
MTTTNVLKGVTPVAATWDTDPTSLANTTDEDITTTSGVGSKVMSGSGTYGTLTYDLGETKTVIVGARVYLKSTAGTTRMDVHLSFDNSTYRNTDQVTPGLSFASTSGKTGWQPTIIAPVRYIRLNFAVDAASTAYARIDEVWAYQVG